MFVRIFLGAFAGCVLGSLIEIFGAEFFGLWGDVHNSGPRLPIRGASIGAVILALIGAVAGEYELNSWMKRLSISTLSGVVSGVLIGAFIFAPLATLREMDPGDLFWGKSAASNRIIGIVFGAPLGAILGLILGVILVVRGRNSR